jgi:hypothetical protein
MRSVIRLAVWAFPDGRPPAGAAGIDSVWLIAGAGVISYFGMRVQPMPDRPRVAVVAGANPGIGWAIIKGLRQRLESATSSTRAKPTLREAVRAQWAGYTLQEVPWTVSCSRMRALIPGLRAFARR